MALINVAHKPITATARQFDGTLEAFLDILSARPLAGVEARCQFSADGTFTGLHLSGGQFGDVAVLVGDWIVFPSDGSFPIGLPGATAGNDWQPV